MATTGDLPNKLSLDEEITRIIKESAGLMIQIPKLGGVTAKPIRPHVTQNIDLPVDAGVVLAIAGQENVFIAGGYARRAVMGKWASPEPSDIDLYARSEETYIEARDRLAIVAVQHTSHPNSERFVLNGIDLPVELIRPVKTDLITTYGTPEDVIDQFSFTVEQFALDERDGQWVAIMGPNTVADTYVQHLELVNPANPIAIVHRLTEKYAKWGWRVPLSLIIQLFQKWEEKPQEWRDRVLASGASDVYQLLTIQ